MGVYMGTLRVGVEVPAYEVLVKTASGVEIRRYAPVTAAAFAAQGETEVSGGGTGFRPLARYIGAFGKPQNQGEVPIKMTAPVTTEKTASDAYVMRFLLPSAWTRRDAPEPIQGSGVMIEHIPERLVAAKFFSGSCRSDEVVDAQEEAVRAALPITTDDGKVFDAVEGKAGRRELARYNDPFTPSFLRTNEVWVPVELVGQPA